MPTNSQELPVTTHDPALVERVAHALAAAEWPTAQWNRIPVTAHDTYRRMARAALDAITEDREIVELPAPDGPLGSVGGVDRGLAWRRVAGAPTAEAGGVATIAVSGWSRGEVMAGISCLRTPADARWAAAALLAAAAAAERAE